jgi:class 3 adenylate cyclase
MNGLEEEIRKLLDNAKKSQEIAASWIDQVPEAIARAISGQMPDMLDPHRTSYESFDDSFIASILFMDIVRYSALETDAKQRKAIESLNRIVRNALAEAGCRLDDVVCLPTGDGMCLCFKNTDGPLKVAAEVHTALAKENKKRGSQKLELRMGIHCGNVLKVRDLKGSYNLAGAAINISQRAMNCGDEGHILCTEKAYNELKNLDAYENTFLRIEEPFVVKHGAHLRLYNHVRRKIGNSAEPRR